MLKTLAIVVALLGAFSLAQAQDAATGASIERQASGESAKPIRLGVFVSIKPDCTTGPLPAIRLSKAPANGTVVVKNAKIRMTNVKACLAVEVPAYVVFYTSRADFSGKDEVQLEVKNAVTSAVQVQNFTVTVASKGVQI